MSAWSSREGHLGAGGPVLAAPFAGIGRRWLVAALPAAGLLLAAEGFVVTRSPVLAAIPLALLAIALATEVPLVATVGVALLVRVLTSEALSSPQARYSTTLNLSGLIAVGFILLAAGLLLRRRRQVGLSIVAVGWLALFTVVAIGSHGAATLTFREGVREASIVAVGVIVWNSRGAFSVSRAVRIVQIAGIGSAVLAIYQFLTHSGMNIEGDIRSNGTFTHPNGAAMYFAIAVTASLWRYLELGRRRMDAALMLVFAAATISTFSVGGLASLLAMLFTFGLTRPTSTRVKLGSCAMALLLVAAFFATPLGAKRIANESSTSVSTSDTRGTANTSLAWRFYKWRTLLPLWEQAPLLGQGLGSTVTAEGTSENVTAGKVPHNEYVRYLVETGAVGLASLLLGMALLARNLARSRRLAGSQNVASLGLGVLAGCALNGMGDNTLLYSTTGYAAVLLIAASLVHLARLGGSEAI